ncbi:25226_t:CDS:10, partial [Dentiscutata erythropus]
MKYNFRTLTLFIASAFVVSTCADPSESSTTIVDEKPEFKPTKIKAPFLEQFTSDWSNRWSPSSATKETKEGDETFSYVGKWEVEEPRVYPGIKDDKGLVMKSAAAHHAISALKFQDGLECGGAYLKLLTESEKGIQAVEFSDKTPYTIMFGPDKCGSTNKIHFIFRHKNPKTGEYEEKHLKSAPSASINKISTLYSLIVRPDNTFEIQVNNESVKSGNLLEDFTPPINPPKEIDDPNDKKPSDWVDDPKIPDPSAKKPDDWDEDAPLEIPDEDATKPEGWLDDEPLNIPDPEAKKPADWDDEEDGDWIPPTVSNPKCEEAPGCGEWKRPNKRNPNYKGKWYPPQIDNPKYKGAWAPRKIPNPDFFEDLTPSNFEKIGAVGFELWTMQSNILFDNIYLGHSEEDAQEFAEETWGIKHKIEKAAEAAEFPEPQSETPSTIVDTIQKHVNEFLEIFYEDPMEAFKEKPEVAGGLAGLVVILFLLLGASASHKKTDEPTPDDEDADNKGDASTSKDD